MRIEHHDLVSRLAHLLQFRNERDGDPSPFNDRRPALNMRMLHYYRLRDHFLHHYLPGAALTTLAHRTHLDDLFGIVVQELQPVF